MAELIPANMNYNQFANRHQQQLQQNDDFLKNIRARRLQNEGSVREIDELIAQNPASDPVPRRRARNGEQLPR